MLRTMRFRTKLLLIVLIPMLGAVALAVPGVRTRLRDLDVSQSARAQVAPATSVRTFLRRLDDEGSLSAWWVATGDLDVKARLRTARVATDQARRALPRAERAATSAGAAGAARGIRDLGETLTLLGRQRQFVDLRFTPDGSVLGNFRDIARDATGILDAFARAPRSAAAAIMFRDEATFARLESALSDERSILALAFGRHQLTDSLASDLIAAVTTQNAARRDLEGQGRAATRAQIQTGVDQFRRATDRVREQRAPVLASQTLRISDTAADWYATATAQLRGWQAIGDRVAKGIDQDLAQRQNKARSDLLLVGLGSLGLLILAGGLAALIARATTRPLRQLANTAHDVATRQLPALVNALHDPKGEPQTITPITVRSRDELGALAKAFNHVERMAIEVADQQRETVRTGISDLFINLARRNQPLIARQLSVIDSLESEERDPDRLGSLFTLDHLATRMRRNSDSLLVLAGVDEKVAGRANVPLLDVVRGAVSETTDFARIDTAGIASDVEIVGYAATDVAHLLSELLENATSFSTPASRVLVATQPSGDGIELVISDKGIGISVERMTALNKLLADPPPPGLVLSRSLGLVVVARLAQRTGVSVALRSAPTVGTAAVLKVPASLVRRIADAPGAVDLVEEERTSSVVDVRDEAMDGGVADPAAASSADLTAPDLAPDPEPAVAGVAAGELPKRFDATDSGLPRRRPANETTTDTAAVEPASDVSAPPNRPADAVFEFVARFEAGRRRAQTDDTGGDEL